MKIPAQFFRANKKIIFIFPGFVLLVWLLYMFLPRESPDNRMHKDPDLYVSPESSKTENPETVVNRIQKDGAVIRKGLFNPGFTKTAWWIYVPLTQASEKQWIQVANPQINTIKIFLHSSDKWVEVYRSGDYYSFQNRLLDDPDFWYKLPDGTKEVLLYADKKGESLTIPLRLVKDENLASYLSGEKILYGMFAGWFLLLFITNVFLGISLRDPIHLFYILYITASALWVISQWGMGFQYLWPDYPEFANKSKPVFANFSFLFLLELTKRYFTAPNQKPVFQTIVRVVQALLIISTTGILLTQLPSAGTRVRMIYLGAMNIIWIAGTIVILLYLLINRKQTITAGIFLAAISTIAFFVLLILFSQYSIHTEWVFAVNKYGSPAGTLIESTILSFGITQRYNFYKREKEKAQALLDAEIKKAADRVIQTQEEERQRLARELHDGLGGLLGGIRIAAHHNLQAFPQQQEWIGKQLELAIKDLRNIAHDLMPVNLAEQGLEKVLIKTIERWNQAEDLDIKLHASLAGRYALPVEAGLYRITSELLYNIKKHAQATEVNIDLWEDPARGLITLIVEDNGRGFDPAKTEGLGWKNIRYRVQYMHGKVFIDSNSNGTTVIVELPLQ
jgi:signal transduction histidine kinase